MEEKELYNYDAIAERDRLMGQDIAKSADEAIVKTLMDLEVDEFKILANALAKQADKELMMYMEGMEPISNLEGRLEEVILDKPIPFQRTLVLAGYPGVGKSTFFQANRGKLISDSDSSLFSWINTPEGKERNPDFPKNYIEHIQRCIEGNFDVIFVSTHNDVLHALVDAGIHFQIVYPERDLKDEYIKRYTERGSDAQFVELMDKMWDKFHDDIESFTKAPAIKLTSPSSTMETVVRFLTTL